MAWGNIELSHIFNSNTILNISHKKIERVRQLEVSEAIIKYCPISLSRSDSEESSNYD